ncbi:integral membrane protein S linking to the trans Golgi network-domain-containing protein [Pisolithus tinctorius]|nr:integral membrane protein S linking to the trans Golgi network-domain-containing protein [Pisolithus tinctorius]
MPPSRHPTSWDPALLISQIISMQTLHYLVLSVLIPPLLSLFAEPSSLLYEGGAANVGMIMDWREMAGKPTVRGMPGEERWRSYYGAWSGGRRVGGGWEDSGIGRIDPTRGWVIAISWMIACTADIYFLYTLIRRPRLILDFALTLVFIHLVLTTYYSASIPNSSFFWFILVAGSAWTVIVAEQLCVKREMTEGLVVSRPRDEDEEMELGGVSRSD